MYKIMANIGNIVKGHINELLDINEDISKNRLQVCYRCPLYSYKLGGICNSRLWLNPNTGDVSTTQKEGYVRGCNCRLNAKTRLPNATCPANKW